MKEKIIENMNKYQLGLSEYACKNSDAIRFKEEENDLRPPFFRDIDRIIYSLSYLRYTDKTQVFSFNENDHISKRMTHVQMVSKIARTIGRALNLNEDLIEASALGHDLGHVPFGHPGEYILSDLSLAHGEGYFNHNIQSVRNLSELEDNGKGKNLCLQTLDAIMCHNGEFLKKEYYPKPKTKEAFLAQYESSYRESNITKTFVPMTLEGCVVRLSDIIAYIGKDIEDAIRLGVLKTSDLPRDIVSILGTKNKEIVNTIVSDIIDNSLDKPYIKMSDPIFESLAALKKYNTEHIYMKANSKENLDFFKDVITTVFEASLKDLKADDKASPIWTIYLNDMADNYLQNTSDERKVIDYIAGMTDDFITKQYEKIIGKLEV